MGIEIHKTQWEKIKLERVVVMIHEDEDGILVRFVRGTVYAAD